MLRRSRYAISTARTTPTRGFAYRALTKLTTIAIIAMAIKTYPIHWFPARAIQSPNAMSSTPSTAVHGGQAGILWRARVLTQKVEHGDFHILSETASSRSGKTKEPHANVE